MSEQGIVELKINTIEKDINGINQRVSGNEKEIQNLATHQKLFDVKFESLVDKLAEMPNTVSQMKETVLMMQNENKNIISLIQNENKSIINRLETLEKKSDEKDSDIKVYFDKELKRTHDEIEKIKHNVNEINEDGKFNIRKFIKEKWIYILLTAGSLSVLIPKLLELLNK